MVGRYKTSFLKTCPPKVTKTSFFYTLCKGIMMSVHNTGVWSVLASVHLCLVTGKYWCLVTVRCGCFLKRENEAHNTILIDPAA